MPGKDTGNDLYDEQGRSSQMPQYDDITLRNLEVFNVTSSMLNSLVTGKQNETLLSDLNRFHLFFSGLYFATYLETSLRDDDKDKVKGFWMSPYVKPLQGNISSNENRQILQDSIQIALEVFDIYQQAMQKAGYRKTTYMTLKPEKKWRKIG